MKRAETSAKNRLLDSLFKARASKKMSPRSKGGSTKWISGLNFESKRAEMTIGTIIAIIIGIAILTLSVYAIVHYKSNLKDKISSTVSESTLDDLVLTCNSEAEMGQENNFCCAEKTLKTNKLDQKTTCGKLAKMNISNNRITGLDCENTVC